MTSSPARKKIVEFCMQNLPLDTLKRKMPGGPGGGTKWSGDDDKDRALAQYVLDGLWDPQSVGFMVDILPYFYQALRDDSSAYRDDTPLFVLDVGARTAAGSNLLGQIFFGTWSRRKITVDVLDIDPTYRSYVQATKRFVRKFIVDDVRNVESGSYDYVIASHVVEHIPDPVPFIDELRRIARKRVIIYCPYNEYDPIQSHHTVSDDLLEAVDAQDVVVTDKSWFWKRVDRPGQETVLFWVRADGEARSDRAAP